MVKDKSFIFDVFQNHDNLAEYYAMNKKTIGSLFAKLRLLGSGAGTRPSWKVAVCHGVVLASRHARHHALHGRAFHASSE